MQVYVNDKPVEVLPGMTVRHALIYCGASSREIADIRVFDAWGNELGLDGELSDGERLFTHARGK